MTPSWKCCVLRAGMVRLMLNNLGNDQWMNRTMGIADLPAGSS
jgi:hypothetical protein